MKNFYDVWVLATTYTFESGTLGDSIRSTFDIGDTPLPMDAPLALTSEFARDAAKKAQWIAFVRKGKLLANESSALNQIVPIIEKLVMPVKSAKEALA
jgi:hypothetical protein